jgi:hypothetical protein
MDEENGVQRWMVLRVIEDPFRHPFSLISRRWKQE